MKFHKCELAITTAHMVYTHVEIEFWFLKTTNFEYQKWFSEKKTFVLWDDELFSLN